MKKRVATIILNRNLPEVTNKLYSMLKKYNQKESIFHIRIGIGQKETIKKLYMVGKRIFRKKKWIEIF